MPSKTAYLNAMGIDVWIRRPVRAVPRAVDPQLEPDAATGGGAESNEATQERPSAAVQPVDIPHFRMGLIHYESSQNETIALCTLIPEGAAFPKRFADDLARVMGGNLEAARYQELNWPMLSSANIDQSIDAAREVVRRKFEVLGARVIVLGDTLNQYLPAMASIEPWQTGTLGRQSVLVTPAFEELNTAEAKRRLLQALMAWQH